jgi:hypothetical protein
MVSTPRRSLRVRLVDLPGSLHELTALVAAEGVNIVRLEVVSWEQSDVWDDLELTADSEEQLDAVVSSLKSRGLSVIGLPAAWSIRDWATDVLHALETIGRCETEGEAVEAFAATAAALANVGHAFVLMEPAYADAAAAETRWRLISDAAAVFDPDDIEWSGSSVGSRIVVSAMRTARAELASPVHRPGPVVGAVIPVPVSTRRPAHLAVLGRRPLFLGPELGRLTMFAQVAAPHLTAVRFRASA